MLIDCGTCRGHAEGRCGDCVVTVLSRLPRPPAARVPDPSPSAPPTPSSCGRVVAARTTGPGEPDEPGGADTGDGWLPLDRSEAVGVEIFVRAGMIHPDEVARLRARPQTWRRHRAAG